VTIPEIDVHQLAALGGEVSLIDVREPAEWVEGHVPQARLIPLGDLGARIDEVPTVGTVYLICRSGARSAHATGALRDRGVDAVNVAGGTDAWRAAGQPIATGE
jgi:rhodanese-related sulfurtransferase